MMRVLMFPKKAELDNASPSGIVQVCQAYYRYSASVGIEYVECNLDDYDAYDVLAIHAGMTTRFPPHKPLCAHLHGLYWELEYPTDAWQQRANHAVIATIRHAHSVTVPSAWVAKPLQRDMHLDPLVIPHGIEWEAWQHSEPPGDWVLWNKNRGADACSPEAVGILAQRFPAIPFVTTFATRAMSDNVTVLGLLPHAEMQPWVQQAKVYLSTPAETFGIGVLEAMASGVPVLAWAHGHNVNLVQHGLTGYLAVPGNYDDLATGLEYCIKYADDLGENGRAAARAYTWERAMPLVRQAYGQALATFRWEQQSAITG